LLRENPSLRTLLAHWKNPPQRHEGHRGIDQQQKGG
jgi:hypothetical protein